MWVNGAKVKGTRKKTREEEKLRNLVKKKGMGKMVKGRKEITY
jgi:hypothetical protein